MATDTAVVFEGRRWPAARVPSVTRQGFGLTASGKGQHWTAERPSAIWRSFSEVDLSDMVMDKTACLPVENFLKRHGDPTGQLDRTAAAGERIASNTHSWLPLIKALKQVAAAWDKPDALGISSLSKDVPRLAAADKALRQLLPADHDGDQEIKSEIETVFTYRLTLRPRTLRAFMVLSAASARQRFVDMRRCLNCNDWFELRRTDAVYCSPSCQAVAHKRRNSELHFRLKRHSETKKTKG